MNPFSMNLDLTEFELHQKRTFRHLVTMFVIGKPKPKERIRYVLAGKWGKWKPTEALKRLTSFLRLLKSYFIEPELPAEDLQERIRQNLDILLELDKLPAGKPKVIGFTPSSTIDFEELVAKRARKVFKGKPSKARLAIYMKLSFSSKTWADVDNLEKSIIDGLVKGGVIANDRTVEVHLTFRDYEPKRQIQGVLLKVYEIIEPFDE